MSEQFDYGKPMGERTVQDIADMHNISLASAARIKETTASLQARKQAILRSKRREHLQWKVAETQQRIATLKERTGVGDDHRLVKRLQAEYERSVADLGQVLDVEAGLADVRRRVQEEMS